MVDTHVCEWTNHAGVPVGRAEFDTEDAAERHATWVVRRGGEGVRAVVWCRGGVEVGA